MVIRILFLLLTFSYCIVVDGQIIAGNFYGLPNQSITLSGFNGFTTYSISSAKTDEKGNFKLNYSDSDYGMGYLMSTGKKPFFLILSEEDIELVGESLNQTETLKIIKGEENQWFEQYAQEQPKREQAFNAWIYLEKLYSADSLFSVHQKPNKTIQIEKQRIINEDAVFLRELPKNSYASWFLPVRKLVSSVSTVAQYRQEEIPSTIEVFRALDYADQRFYKSGLLKDAIDNHFWLIENSGKSIEAVYLEMQQSIDAMMVHLAKDDKKLNEVTKYLFDLLERHSLFQASEYLAIKVLNETSCTIDNDLAKQLETYRAMKKGNIAPDINLNNNTYLKGVKQNQYKSLKSLKSPYSLVVFGASWCPKCTEEIPKIIPNYSKWHGHGVEVVYVSLDTEQAIFEESTNQFPFLVYCDFKKWDSQTVQDYHVFSTPTMFLMDDTRKILLRPHSVEQIDAWIDWNLVQENQ